MTLKPKSKVISTITTSVKKSKGREYEYYVADCGSSIRGKRIRIVRATRAECIKAVNEYYEKAVVNGAPTCWSSSQMMDANLALTILRDKGMNNITLTRIVEDYIASHQGVCTQVSVLDAYKEYYDSFPAIQDMHKKCIQSRVGRLAQAIPQKMVCDVTSNDIMAHLDSFGDIAPKTWNNHKQYISSFFEWCAKKVRRYCVENPIADLERKMIAYKTPEFASIKATMALFIGLASYDKQERDILTTYFTLSFFCGMRKNEILRLQPDDVHLEDGSIFVRMPKGWTRGMAPRTFHIMPNAKKWLNKCDWQFALNTGISEKLINKHIAKLRDMGHDIPKNAGRHSFITYHVAAYGQPAVTEGIVGTSSKMRTSHYMGLATQRDGETYFTI